MGLGWGRKFLLESLAGLCSALDMDSQLWYCKNETPSEGNLHEPLD